MTLRRVLIALLLLFALILIYFPKLASTTLGKRYITQRLGSRLSGTLEIQSIHLSWFGPQKFHQIQFSNRDLSATIEELTSNAPLWSLRTLEGAFLLKNGSVSFSNFETGSIKEVNGQVEGTDFHLTGVTQSRESAGVLELKGKVYSHTSYDLQANFTNLPVAILDQFFQTKNLLYQILGETLNVQGTIVLNQNHGPIDLTLSSSNLKTSLQGLLTANTLRLKEPLDVALVLTPGLSEALLNYAGPLFLTGIKAKNPIHLHISPDGFSVGFHPFSLKNIQIRKGVLDMGKVQCRNGKALASLIYLLKVTSLADAVQMNAWFAPLRFSLNQGIFEAARMDALIADSIHICTWGKIDLLKDQIDMFLGLPADTLSQSFGIKNLPPTYVLKMPIRGSTKEPELIKGPASAKIAALIAAQQPPLKKGIFKKLVNALAQTQTDPDVPPETRPFPWES